MIGRKNSSDVFVLGQEELAEAGDPKYDREAIAPISRAVDREVEVAAEDPFRIPVESLRAERQGEGNGASPTRQVETVERSAREQLALSMGKLRTGGRAVRTASRLITPSSRQVAAAGGTAVALLGLMLIVRDGGGRPEPVAQTDTISAVSEAEGPALPPVAVPHQPSKRDSRSRSTREGERQGPQAAAPSSPAAAAPVPSVPAAPTPSPPSQGGGSGGRETFGFEQ